MYNTVWTSYTITFITVVFFKNSMTLFPRTTLLWFYDRPYVLYDSILWECSVSLNSSTSNLTVNMSRQKKENRRAGVLWVRNHHLWVLRAFMNPITSNLKVTSSPCVVSHMIFMQFFWLKYCVSRQHFPHGCSCPSRRYSPSRLNGEFPFEVCSLYGFAANVQGLFYSLIGAKGPIWKGIKERGGDNSLVSKLVESNWTGDNVSAWLAQGSVFNPLGPVGPVNTASWARWVKHALRCSVFILIINYKQDVIQITWHNSFFVVVAALCYIFHSDMIGR